jgi:FkbM family methyltransferase
MIAHNAALNGFGHVRVQAEALGRADGDFPFRVSAVTSWGKLADVGPVAQEQGLINVPVCRLDSLEPGTGLRSPNIIKIDVEGAEVDVLAGGMELLRKARPMLLIELHGTNVPVTLALDDLGYRVRVLGSDKQVVDSPWDAKIVATPAERVDLARLADELMNVET